MLARLRLPISFALLVGPALVIIAAVSVTFGVSFLGAKLNTDRLLDRTTMLSLELVEGRVRGLLEPVEGAATNLATTIGQAPDLDERTLAAAFDGVRTALPQISGIVFIDQSFRSVASIPSALEPREYVLAALTALQLELGSDVTMADLLLGAEGMRQPVWLPPLWVDSLQQPVLSFELPVHKDEDFLGLLLVFVALGNISDYLSRIETDQGTSAFVLYDNQYVLAHPQAMAGVMGVDMDTPLPMIADFPDPALRIAQDPSAQENFVPGMADMSFLRDGIRLRVRDVARFGERPWQVGFQIAEADLNRGLQGLWFFAVVSVIGMAAALVIGLSIGRLITGQIRHLAVAAERLRTLDIDGVGTVPNSVFRELSDAAGAFNALTAAMRSFEMYVPKPLVRRLIAHADDRAIESAERELTVMFTDIKGFSALSERTPPAEVAAMLNGHFELLSRCIEASGGTVDKFIGDSVMAFWGAPDRMDDHAARAIGAAQAIQRGVAAANAAGGRRIDIRVGLHTGKVVVGNIGSTSRVNYTVVGDVVNTASRLEALGKEVDGDSDCMVLLSEATVAASGGTAPPVTEVGRFQLKGRVEKTTVFALTPAAAGGDAERAA